MKRNRRSLIDPRLISDRPGEMGLAEDPRPFISDGMGALVEDMRSLLDIIIEPGVKFAPFQGLSAEMVARRSQCKKHARRIARKA